MKIRAIIFDLGGVLLRTADFSPRDRLASRLGISRHELEGLVFGGDSGDKAQRGEISVREHWENLRQKLNCSPDALSSLLDEFFAQDELDQELVGYVRRLHQTYKTALLSNAWDDLRQVIVDKWHFEDAFDELIISAEVKLVKPNPRIYQLACDKLGVIAGEAVFIDDIQNNIEGARAAGLQAIHFHTFKQMKEELEVILDKHQG